MTSRLVWFVASVTVRSNRPTRPRTWCFFWTKDEAVEYVLSSVFLLSEDNYYTHAVIEAHGAGDVAIANEEHWFRLDAGKHLPLGKRGQDYVEPVDVAVSVEKPIELKNVINFCLG